jgi:hypothetical protein
VISIDYIIYINTRQNRRASDYPQAYQRDRETGRASFCHGLRDKRMAPGKRRLGTVIRLQKLLLWYPCLGADGSQGRALDFAMIGQCEKISGPRVSSSFDFKQSERVRHSPLYIPPGRGVGTTGSSPRVVHKKLVHGFTCIRTLRIGVRTGGAASRPGMP